MLAGVAEVNLALLLLTIFFFFFTETLLQHIVSCTDARAEKLVVVVTEGGKKVTRKKRTSDPPSLVPRRRISGWVTLTVAELLYCLTGHPYQNGGRCPASAIDLKSIVGVTMTLRAL